MPPAPTGKESFPPCPTCHICHGSMELVYDRFNQQVCVCTDCHSGITIPSSAWEVQRLKRENKWDSGNDSRAKGEAGR